MNRERIAHLIEVLKKVNAMKYDQGRYIGISSYDKPLEQMISASLDDEVPSVLREPPFVCHTSACALGWAAFDPEFQAEGLVWVQIRRNYPLVWRNLDWTQGFRYTGSPDQAWHIVVLGRDDQGKVIENQIEAGSRRAGVVFFDLTDEESEAIFGGGRDTLAQKIAQLEHFLDTEAILHASCFEMDGTRI